MVVVPDEFSTIQLAIDSGADTVGIREGTYSERPVIDRAVVLLGVGVSRRPRLAGLQVYNLNFSSPYELRVSGLDFSGRVAHQTLTVHPRNLQLSFLECGLDSGLQIVNLDTQDIAVLWLYRCRMAAGSYGQVDNLYMVADTIDGGVSWRARHPNIEDCWFRGGEGRAIELTGDPVIGPLARNTIENYGTGISCNYSDLLILRDNEIRRCAAGFALTNCSEAYVTGNTVRDCGIGIAAAACDLITVSNNTIVAATGLGIAITALQNVRGPLVERNVVGRCGDHGIFIEGAEDGVVRGNTVFENIGSGIVVTRNYGQQVSPIAIHKNISYGNGAWGVRGPGEILELACNDWFLNALGPVFGIAKGSSDLTVDPMFCDVDSADVRLNSASPLVGVSGCDQIGALGVGCGKTATLVQRFTAHWVSDGIKITWQVVDGATASAVWVERAEAEGGGWSQPVTDRSVESGAVVELDRSAVPDRAFWYRLVAQEGAEALVIGAAIEVAAQARPRFQLEKVSPSPGWGPLRIEFGLPVAARIEIDVFDVLGRRVASPLRGLWPAGAQTVVWDGRMVGGGEAPPGLYVVRYRWPGGEDRRPIVRVR